MGAEGEAGDPPAVLRVVVFDDLLAVGALAEEVPPDVDLRLYDRADDAVAVVRDARPDLVLMDYEMNGLVAGDAAVRALRAAMGGSLAILAISASTRGNQRMLAEGADGVVPKTQVGAFLRARAARARGGARAPEDQAEPALSDPSHRGGREGR
ncbi:hypothetical protein L6R50_00505 [Myxococcota bacterium]|nr:hypothetical protein [Myxococcota bacterium]